MPARDPYRQLRIALSVTGIDATAYARALAAAIDREDLTRAMERRNAAIRDAHRLVGSPRILAQALREFHANAFPHLRHLAEPPADAAPLRRAYFAACQAAEDMGCGLPDLRQIRRIINP